MKKIILILMLLFPILIFSQTKNIVPRADSEGQLGTSVKAWAKIYIDSLFLNGISLHTTLSGKAPIANPTFTGNVTMNEGFSLDPGTGGIPILVTAVEFNYLSGITSGVQSQINAKQDVITTGSIGATQIASTSVTAGSYTSTNLTVDADGRITAASNGTGGSSLDTNTVINIVDQFMIDSSYTSTYTGEEMDSLLALAGTALQDVAITFPDANTISFGDNTAIQLDPSTLEINGSNQLTVIGGTNTDSSIFATKYYVDTEIETILNEADVRVPFVWAYLQLDTTGSVSDIVDKAEAEVSTLETSGIFGVSANSVVRVAVDSARYKVKYDLAGVPTWTDWLTSAAYYKDVDSAQVQHYSSASNSTTTLQRFYVSDDVDTFSVTTTAGGGGGGAYEGGNLRFYWHEDSLATGQIGELGTPEAWYDSIVDSMLWSAGAEYAPYKDADSGVVFYSSDYVRMAPPSNLLYGTGLSFEVVVNLTSLTSPNEQVIIGARYNSPNIQIFQIGVEQGDSIFVYQYDDGTEYAVEVNGNPALNNYIHIVGTTDHSGNLHLYFNGVEQTDNTNTPVFNFMSVQYLYIGGESTSYNLALGSAIRYIRIYDDVLTPTEVEANYDWAVGEGLLTND